MSGDITHKSYVLRVKQSPVSELFVNLTQNYIAFIINIDND